MAPVCVQTREISALSLFFLANQETFPEHPHVPGSTQGTGDMEVQADRAWVLGVPRSSRGDTHTQIRRRMHWVQDENIDWLGLAVAVGPRRGPMVRCTRVSKGLLWGLQDGMNWRPLWGGALGKGHLELSLVSLVWGTASWESGCLALTWEILNTHAQVMALSFK